METRKFPAQKKKKIQTHKTKRKQVNQIKILHFNILFFIFYDRFEIKQKKIACRLERKIATRATARKKLGS